MPCQCNRVVEAVEVVEVELLATQRDSSATSRDESDCVPRVFHETTEEAGGGMCGVLDGAGEGGDNLARAVRGGGGGGGVCRRAVGDDGDDSKGGVARDDEDGEDEAEGCLEMFGSSSSLGRTFFLIVDECPLVIEDLQQCCLKQTANLKNQNVGMCVWCIHPEQ